MLVAACSASLNESQPTTSALPDGREAPRTSHALAPAEKKQTVRVALLLPLSAPGQTAVVAASMKRAAELAVFDFADAPIEITTRDDKGTPEGARAAVEEAVKSGAELIIGPVFSRSVVAAAPIARAGGVPMVAFSNDRQAAGGNVYLLSFLPSAEVARIVGYAAAQGKRRFVALIPDDALGKTVEASFREAVPRNGGTIVASETYAATTAGMLEAARRVKAAIQRAESDGAPVDALFLPGGEEVLAPLAPLLRQVDIDTQRIKLVSTGGLDYPNAGRDPALVGAWYPAPDPRGWREFAEKFAKAQGHAPPRIASLAYDAVALASALAGGPKGARYTAATLTRAAGFSGVDGAVRLNQDGTAERALAVFAVQSFGASVIETSPAALGPAATATGALISARSVAGAD